MNDTPETQTITLIGCGKMGGAMLKGWLKTQKNTHFAVITPSAAQKSPKTGKTEHFTTPEDAKAALNQSKIIIFAVKPQIMPTICAKAKPFIAPNAAIMSIAAGQTIANFESYFSPQQPIIRTMPNTPAAIGKGITVATANPHVTRAQKQLANALLESSGKVEWIDDENLLDAVTAVSGSGPAYIFHMIEALAEAGAQAGLPPDLSMTLARQTVIGAAALAESQPDITATTLRENVTSTGGTTAAALEILMNGEWQKIMNKAVKNARDRGAQLRKNS